MRHQLRYLIFLLALLLPAGMAAHNAASTQRVGLVSLVQLISNPGQYDGKIVAVIGFLRLEFEGNELYLGRDDYIYGVTKNGLWVNLAPDLKNQAEQLDMHYVLLVGVFSAKNKGHMSLTSGTIDAASAMVWPREGPRKNSHE